MTSAPTAATAPAHQAADDREVVITRLIDAPRALVFAAWADRRHLAHWWHPPGFAEVHLDEMEFKPGGLLRMRMITPERITFRSRGVYREIVAPARLVYDEMCEEDGRLFHQARYTVSFEAQADQTLLTIRARLSWVADRDPRWTPPVMRAAWSTGWSGNLDLLGAYLPRATFIDAPGRELVLARLIQAPREQVFRAWADPERLARWWGPEGCTIPLCEGDVRVGGAWRIVMRAPDGTAYPLHGTYLDIAAPERLVLRVHLDQHPPELLEQIRLYRAAHPAQDAGYDGELILTALFEARGEATWLTVRDRFGSAAERDAHRELGALQGWVESLDRLSDLLAPPPSSHTPGARLAG